MELLIGFRRGEVSVLDLQFEANSDERFPSVRHRRVREGTDGRPSHRTVRHNGYPIETVVSARFHHILRRLFGRTYVALRHFDWLRLLLHLRRHLLRTAERVDGRRRQHLVWGHIYIGFGDNLRFSGRKCYDLKERCLWRLWGQSSDTVSAAVLLPFAIEGVLHSNILTAETDAHPFTQTNESINR
jgi:hypothetical protein